MAPAGRQRLGDIFFQVVMSVVNTGCWEPGNVEVEVASLTVTLNTLLQEYFLCIPETLSSEFEVLCQPGRYISTETTLRMHPGRFRLFINWGQ